MILRIPCLTLLVLSVCSCTSVSNVFLGEDPTLTPAEEGAVNAAIDCDVIPITFGSDISGALSSNDCHVNTYRSPSDYNLTHGIVDTTFVVRNIDYYAFRYNHDPGQIRILVESDQIDTYVTLFAKDGREVERNDDSGSGINSLIQLEMRDGVYIIGVSSSRPEEEGDYRLRVGFTTSGVQRAVDGMY